MTSSDVSRLGFGHGRKAKFIWVESREVLRHSLGTSGWIDLMVGKADTWRFFISRPASTRFSFLYRNYAVEEDPRQEAGGANYITQFRYAGRMEAQHLHLALHPGPTKNLRRTPPALSGRQNGLSGRLARQINLLGAAAGCSSGP